ncbi:MAG: alkaline shock response membrane anchor protein AmaP [Sciscionella sp.]
MSSPNRPARLNRGLLILVGVVLLAAGAFSVTTNLGVLHLLPNHDPLLPQHIRLASWVRYLAASVAILLGLGCLRWLVAQGFRRPKTGGWRMETTDDHGITSLDAALVADPLTTDVESYQGVRAAAAWLTGHRRDPTLHLIVRTEHDAELTAIRGQIETHAVPRLCQALDLDALPATVRFTPTATTTRAR